MRSIASILTLACLACHGCGSCVRSSELPRSAEAAQRAPVVAQSCEEARRFPESVPTNDVRFLDCSHPKRGSGEAFELGDPVYDPETGPSPLDPGWYRSGHCDHRGGAVTEFSVYYDDIAVAIDCSRQRCDANDARGCHDLGALHWLSDFLPGVQKDEARATAAYASGCRLGFGDSCSTLASIYKQRHETALEQRMYVAACDASPPVTPACAYLGELLIEQGRAAEAKPYLMRGCRGTTASTSSFAAHRDGCGQLAEAAAARGDSASHQEYLRLECAYGSQAPSACAQLGQMMFDAGDRTRARAYLQRACESTVEAPTVFARACQTLSQLQNDRPTL